MVAPSRDSARSRGRGLVGLLVLTTLAGALFLGVLVLDRVRTERRLAALQLELEENRVSLNEAAYKVDGLDRARLAVQLAPPRVVLSPGKESDGVPTLDRALVGQDGSPLHLVLKLETLALEGPFRLVLRDPAGAITWQGEAVKNPEEDQLALLLRGDQLRVGAYRLVLERLEAGTPLAVFSFRVE